MVETATDREHKRDESDFPVGGRVRRQELNSSDWRYAGGEDSSLRVTDPGRLAKRVGVAKRRQPAPTARGNPSVGVPKALMRQSSRRCRKSHRSHSSTGPDLGCIADAPRTRTASSSSLHIDKRY